MLRNEQDGTEERGEFPLFPEGCICALRGEGVFRLFGI